jgi:hypothetical protein
MRRLKSLIVISMTILAIVGCGRSSDNSNNRVSTGFHHTSSGEVEFDVISKTNTLLDREGNYKDSGHYSILYQALSKKERMPISGLDKDEFYTMYENGKHIDESVMRVSQDSKTVTNKILLLLDFSGSIISDCDKAGAKSDPKNLCYQLVSSSKKFIDKIVSKNQKMAIYYFNSQRKPIPLSNNADPSNDLNYLKSSLDQLYNPTWRDEHLRGYNSTNLYGAIMVAADEVVCRWFQDCIPGKSSEMIDNKKKHYDFATMVIFTDGRHTVGNNVSERELLDDLSLYKRNYYYTIGLGKDVDDDVLKKIGKNGYLKADETRELDKRFDDLGERLNAFANSFYKIDYCPAQQEGTLDLKIEMEDKQRGYYGILEDKIDLLNGVDFRCDLY